MLEKFEKIATRSPFVDYYEAFDERYEHTGYAVTAEGQFEYAQFCLELAAEGLDAIAEERPLMTTRATVRSTWGTPMYRMLLANYFFMSELPIPS